MKNTPQAGHGCETGKRPFLFLLALLAAVFFSGCGRPDFAALRSGIEARGRYLEGVPFYKQTESTCGPAALAQVLSFYGSPATLDSIADKIYLPQLRGTLPPDLENYAREAGFFTHASSGSLSSITEHIGKGSPVICLLDLGFGVYRKPHYITVIGFEDERKVLIAHDGQEPNRVMDYARFEKAWSRAGNWMLVVTPKKEGREP